MKKSLFLISFAILFIFASCKKEQTPPIEIPYIPTPSGLSTSLAGLGAHPGSPVGTTWAFPPSVKVIGSILGGDPGKTPFNGVKTVETWESYMINTQQRTNWTTHGLGMFVSLYMKLYNSSQTPITFIMPSGLLFCNDSSVVDTAQTGVIVVPDTITIPGGDTLKLCLKSFCCNSSRHAPTFTSIYKPRVVSTNDQVVHFIAALKGKSSLPTHESEILSYIWQFTGGTPLSAADYAAIALWP